PLAESGARSAAAANRFVAASLAAVPADVRLRRRETAERRSHVARPDGAHAALRDATFADGAGLVCAPTPVLVSKGLVRGDVRRRTRGAIPDPAAAAPALCRVL